MEVYSTKSKRWALIMFDKGKVNFFPIFSYFQFPIFISEILRLFEELF